MACCAIALHAVRRNIPRKSWLVRAPPRGKKKEGEADRAHNCHRQRRAERGEEEGSGSDGEGRAEGRNVHNTRPAQGARRDWSFSPVLPARASEFRGRWERGGRASVLVIRPGRLTSR